VIRSKIKFLPLSEKPHGSKMKNWSKGGLTIAEIPYQRLKGKNSRIIAGPALAKLSWVGLQVIYGLTVY